MNKDIIINVAKDYTKTPGGRHILEGKFSGEDFRINYLQPKYLEAISSNCRLIVNLDGGYGYAPSFLEEAFGGLVRELKLKDDLILSIIQIISEEEPKLIDDVKRYIVDALEEMNRE